MSYFTHSVRTLVVLCADSHIFQIEKWTRRVHITLYNSIYLLQNCSKHLALISEKDIQFFIPPRLKNWWRMSIEYILLLAIEKIIASSIRLGSRQIARNFQKTELKFRSTLKICKETTDTYRFLFGKQYFWIE